MSLSYMEAHPSGFCDVSYIQNENDGKVHLVTCGKDGKICYRSADKPSEVVKEIAAHSDGENSSPLTCIVAAPSGDRVCVSDEQNFVKVFNFPGGDLHTIVTRFTLPARCIAYSPSGLNLATSGDDLGIKLIDLAGNKVFRTLRSEPYTRGLAYDPEGEYLAATGADGSLTVWNVGTGKAEIVKKKVCSRIDPMAAERLLPAWHPDGGSILAVPASDGSINFYERLSWEAAGELTGQHSSAAHLLAFSKNGLYLASTAADQTLVIWDVVARTALGKKVLPGTVCGMAWHPTENAVAFITDDGQIAVWNGPVPTSLPGPNADVDALAGVKKQTNAGGNTFVDDQAMDDGSDADGSGDEYDREDSFLADSPGRIHNPNAGNPAPGRRSRKHTGHTRGVSFYDAPAFSVLDLPQPQPAVQPGSTTMDAGRRYLSYTSLGAITLRSESDHNTVEVSFHDTSRGYRRVPLLTDFYGFTLGTLGERGALYASPASTDAPSTLVYRPFDAWAPNSEWSLGLAEGEEAECVAAGANFAAVATNARMLRLLSAAGLQTAVITLPGAAVAMAAHGNKLAVAWHAAPPTPAGDQCIEISEYMVPEQRLLRQRQLALSPSATLAWLGYTEEGALAAYDSEGVLRVLSPEFGGTWVPIFSAASERKGGEHFWVFAASLRRSEVQCIVCANAPEPAVPSSSARPVVTAAPIRIPVIAHDESIAPMEAELLRQGLVIAHATTAGPEAGGDEEAAALESALQAAQVESDRAGLRLFTRLAQTDRQARALEVAATLQTSAGLQGAVKIANHHRMTSLAEAVSDLIQQRAAAEEAAAEAEGEAWIHEEPAVPVHRHHAVREAPSQSPLLGPAARRAAETEGEGKVDEVQVLVENGSPNGKLNAPKGGSNTNAAANGGAKRKAPLGNPFARKKAAGTAKKS